MRGRRGAGVFGYQTAGVGGLVELCEGWVEETRLNKSTWVASGGGEGTLIL